MTRLFCPKGGDLTRILFSGGRFNGADLVKGRIVYDLNVGPGVVLVTESAATFIISTLQFNSSL